MQFEMKFGEEVGVVVRGEEWRVVDGFPRYEVSSEGRIRNRGNGRYLSGSLADDGYMHVTVTKDGVAHTRLSHRLVALTFLESPSPKHTEVNHKNRDRRDNRLENLEWVTRSYNAKHGHGTL